MTEPRIFPWNEIDDQAVASWTAIEMVLNMHRQLQQNVNFSFSYGKTLAEGAYGYTNEEQQEALVLLQERLTRMHALIRRMTLWIVMHTDEQGQWIGDGSGQQTVRSLTAAQNIVDSYQRE